jgi:hypothetical protein
MTHIAQVTTNLKAIPARRWRYKIGKLVIAALLGALLYFVALPKDWPVAVILAIAVAVGYCISEDVMKAIVRFLVAVIRDVLAAIKNGKSDGNVQPPS